MEDEKQVKDRKLAELKDAGNESKEWRERASHCSGEKNKLTAVPGSIYCWIKVLFMKQAFCSQP